MSTKTRSVRRRPRTTPKRNTKHTGDLAEILFLVRAVERGLHLSKPFGDNDGYDWIVANQRNILRVQVKSTSTVVNGLYQVNSGRRTTARVVPYDPSEVDILAVLVVPENTWYIIPIADLHGRVSLLLYPRAHPSPACTTPTAKPGTCSTADHCAREPSPARLLRSLHTSTGKSYDPCRHALLGNSTGHAGVLEKYSR